MTFLEIARRWTILILAETLKTTAGAIEAVLPFQPRWLAQIALLATQLRASAVPADEPEEDDAEDAPGLPSLDALLISHTRLRQAVSDLVARGLALDPELLERMRTDWNVDSVVSYLSSAEANLRDTANRALNEAAEPLGMSVAAMTGLAGCAPAAKPQPAPSKKARQATPPGPIAKTAAKPSSTPARQRAPAR